MMWAVATVVKPTIRPTMGNRTRKAFSLAVRFPRCAKICAWNLLPIDRSRCSNAFIGACTNKSAGSGQTVPPEMKVLQFGRFERTYRSACLT